MSIHPEARPKRNYVLRKRFFNQSMTIIKQTLEYLEVIKNTGIDQSAINRIAIDRAKEIEASCWDSRRHMRSEDYGRMIMGKTKQVCMVLINRSLAETPILPKLKALLDGIVKSLAGRRDPPTPTAQAANQGPAQFVQADQKRDEREEKDEMFPQFPTLELESGIGDIQIFEEIRPLDPSAASFEI